MGVRIIAMDWWNSLPIEDKKKICLDNAKFLGKIRKWEHLTGREIEELWNIETSIKAK